MRAIFALLLGVGLVAVFSARADEKKAEDKTVTLKGTIVCTKCELKETKTCGNAIKTKIDGKDVVVYLDDKGKPESYHKNFCTGPAKGSVTGVLSEKDGKKYIKPGKDGVKFE